MAGFERRLGLHCHKKGHVQLGSENVCSSSYSLLKNSNFYLKDMLNTHKPIFSKPLIHLNGLRRCSRPVSLVLSLQFTGFRGLNWRWSKYTEISKQQTNRHG
mgnify:CR=1 FL=1